MDDTGEYKIYDVLAESDLFQERRQYHRVQINDPIRLYYDSETYDEFLGDLSLQGVRVCSYFDYAIGHTIEIGIPNTDNTTLCLKGVVTRCREASKLVRGQNETPREFECHQCQLRVYGCHALDGTRKVMSISAPATLEFVVSNGTDIPRCPTCHGDMMPSASSMSYELGVFFRDITLEQASIINDIIASHLDRSANSVESRRMRGRVSGQFLQDSIECVFEDAVSLHEGSVENLSLDGCFVFSDVDLNEGDSVTVSLGLKPLNRRFKSDALILRRVSREHDSGRYGYAVQFTFIDSDFRQDLTRFLHGIRVRDFEKFRKRHRQLTGQSGQIKSFVPPLVLGIVVVVILLTFLMF